MNTYTSANTGVRVTSKFKALMTASVWKHFDLGKRNFISSMKNYYDVNGFLTDSQYTWLGKLYDNFVERYTEQEIMEFSL